MPSRTVAVDANQVPPRKRLRVSLSAPILPPAHKTRIDEDDGWDDENDSSDGEVNHRHRHHHQQHPRTAASKERRRLSNRDVESGSSTALQRTRRGSLPRSASPRTHHRRSAPSSTTARADWNRSLQPPRQITQHPAAKRRGKILSPLPVNHAVARPIAVPVKYAKNTSSTFNAPRMTRQTSGNSNSTEATTQEATTRPARAKRHSHTSQIDTRPSQDSSGDVDMDEEDVDATPRRVRNGLTRTRTEQHDDEDESDGELSQDDYCLNNASTSELRRLLRSELIRLYIQATNESSTTAAGLNKDQLIQGVVNARAPESHDAEHSTTEEEEMSDGADSPRPYTSHEASPDLDTDPRKGSKKRGEPRRTSRIHTDMLQQSSDSSGSSSISNRNGSTRSQIARSEPTSRQLRPRRSSTHEDDLEATEAPVRGARLTRRLSQTRSRSGTVTENSEELGVLIEEPEDFASPIAHRTRHGTQAPAVSPRSRPRRAAKAKAVARIRTIDGGSDTDDGENEDEDGDDAMAEFEAGDHHTSDGNDPAGRRGARRNTRSRSASIEPSPSDADEESGGEEADEDVDQSEAEMAVSHLRGPRNNRKGKVIALRVMACEEDLTNSEYIASTGMDEDEVEEEDDDGTDVDLRNATSKTLLRRRRDDLVRLCEERELTLDGTKKDLVHALLQWREAHHDSESSDSDSDNSTASGASNMTARAETKTQALRAAETARPRRKSADTPRLMRADHSCSPEKPRTPARSKEDEQEEVNALDLESLQLQDKEIAPEKLTKLEKVGSGGFKDVYKGMYRKKVIAIADIRGHLTDMDVKELGLLRDLRHPNIVHFIGVSIPKEPLSSVPVMIVTELCANGDLFDYIRGVSHPPFLSMLEIMLGISRGLEYLHTRTPGIIHRDIKSSNVLITANGTAKLNDFGLARIKNSTRSMIRSLVGTVNWQAPELWVSHPRYNEKVDVYSVGLVFWETLQWHQPVKRYPFEGLNEHAIYDQVGHKRIRPSTASMRRAWGGEVVDLVSAMWDQDPAARPPMTQVVLEIQVLITAEKERLAAERRRRD